ncbi:MAG TPA: hypothetical protein VGM37_12530 [Armatimonadota bacterium]|jgi:hypothetical protein
MAGIKERCEASFAEFLEAIDGVTEAEAGAFRIPNWPTHEWHAGEDGSIAGLAWHVAVWKGVYLSALRTGSFGDRSRMRPDEDTWAGRTDWLRRTHASLMEYLARLEASGVETLTVDNRERRLSAIFADDFTEHDRYHAAQVWYLRQRYRAEHGE